tara:strand:+ start:4618 stop:4995 length:378 start_codon:yes stop_codon:yes gene_type:complete
MANSAVTMLTHTASMSYTGSDIKADGYYGYTDGLHTVAIKINGFYGRIYIEGTLEKTPTTDDWFPLQLSGNSDYLDYGSGKTTATVGKTFYGNFTYLRARVDRSHIVASYDESTHGRVDSIRLLI